MVCISAPNAYKVSVTEGCKLIKRCSFFDEVFDVEQPKRAVNKKEIMKVPEKESTRCNPLRVVIQVPEGVDGYGALLEWYRSTKSALT